MKTPQASAPRRRFILAGMIGTAATAAFLIPQMRVVSRVHVDDQVRNQGYRLTEHIEDYYRTIRI